MKRIAQVLMASFVMAVFLVTAFSIVMAADRPAAPAATQVAPGTLQKATTVKIPMMCPPGWHQKKNTTEEFKCAPNKPAAMQCPEGWKYVEALDCQSFQGLGTQTMCGGCEVGCLKIPVIK